MTTAFWILGLFAVITAGIAVTRESPIYAAIFTLLSFGAIAGEFLLLHASFLAAMQVLLYGGAIMVLFVFVIMLLSLKKEEQGEEPPLATKVFAGLVSLAVLVALIGAAKKYQPRDPNLATSDARLVAVAPSGGPGTGRAPLGSVDFGSTEHFGRFLYGSAVVPFELVSVLLTAALAGVVILARRRVPLGAEDLAPSPGAPAPPARQALEAAHLHRH